VVKDFAVVVEEADEFHEGSKRALKEKFEKGNRRLDPRGRAALQGRVKT
jgi:hypothetical protein